MAVKRLKLVHLDSIAETEFLREVELLVSFTQYLNCSFFFVFEILFF